MTNKTHRSFKRAFWAIPLLCGIQGISAMETQSPPESTLAEANESSEENWWGYKVNGPISKNAVQSGIVRLRFENESGVNGEIKSPITCLFCPKQYEQGILKSLTIETNELFVNDISSDHKKSTFVFDKLYPENLCASVNSIGFEEFMNREPFKAELEFNYKKDLFTPVNTLINRIKNDFSLLEHIVVNTKDDSPPNHRWKFPKEVQVLVDGNPFSIWAVNFNSECNSGMGSSGKPYVRSFEEEENGFNLCFKAYEKDHYRTKVEPEDYKLKLLVGGNCIGCFYDDIIVDPYFVISCSENRFERLNMNLYVHPKF